MCTGRSECFFGKCKCRFGLKIFGNDSKCSEPPTKVYFWNKKFFLYFYLIER
jgi:hypothetical protein